jgi:hypothetical protein
MRFPCLAWGQFVLPACLIGLLSIGLPAQAADEPSSQPTTADEKLVDMAKVHSGGKVAFVSSGQRPAVFHAIDDDRRTIFRFSESDAHPTLIIKLNETRPVHRVSLVPASEAAQVNVYLLDELPRKVSDLDALKPLTSIVNLVVGREAAAEFAPQNARYVALRWILTGPSAGPIKVAEVSAFAQSDTHHASDFLAVADPAASFHAVEPPDVAVVSP